MIIKARAGKIILALVLPAVQVVVLAEDMVEDELIDIYGSEEFVSIATGYRQSVSKAPAVASVITAEKIRAMGANDLEDILDAVPGLHVSVSNQGYFPIFTFRGFYSNFNPQVLLLIDGVPQTNLFTGGKNFVWGGMPVEAIDRVEIIRGPGSAVYGADAFAGVINIISKHQLSSEKNAEIGAKYGSFNSKNVYGNFHTNFDSSALFVSAQYAETDGQDSVIRRDQQSYYDDIAGTSATLAPGQVSLGRQNLDLNLDYRISSLVVRGNYQGRRDWGLGAGIAQALDPSSRYSSDRYQLGFEYTLPAMVEALDVSVAGSYLDVSQVNDEDAVLFPAGSTGPFLTPTGEPIFGVFENGVIGNPEVFERHSRLNTTFHYVGVEDHELTLGLGYYYGDMYKVREEKNYCTDADSCAYILPRLQSSRLVNVSDTPFVFLREADRDNRYLYLQDVYSLANDWQITAGLRYDRYSDFGETVNPRVAVVWSTTNDLTTKFLYGEAFRAPAFAETQAINNPSALGNPDLQPETLKSYELVFDYKVNYDLDLVFNTFVYEWNDIILFVPDGSGGTATARNFGSQDGYGLEVETRWTIIPGLELIGNMAWQKSTNTQTDADSDNAPGQKV